MIYDWMEGRKDGWVDGWMNDGCMKRYTKYDS